MRPEPAPPPARRMARECALLGNYDTAVIYFDTVIKKIQQYLYSLSDEVEKQRWLQVRRSGVGERSLRSLRCDRPDLPWQLKDELNVELSLVKDLTKELRVFKAPPGRALRAAQQGSDDAGARGGAAQRARAAPGGAGGSSGGDLPSWAQAGAKFQPSVLANRGYVSCPLGRRRV